MGHRRAPLADFNDEVMLVNVIFYVKLFCAKLFLRFSGQKAAIIESKLSFNCHLILIDCGSSIGPQFLTQSVDFSFVFIHQLC